MTEGPASAPLAHIEPGAVPFDAPVSGTIAAIFPGLQEEVLAHGDREASSERSSEQEEELSLRSLLARVKKVERNQLYMGFEKTSSGSPTLCVLSKTKCIRWAARRPSVPIASMRLLLVRLGVVTRRRRQN